MRFTSRATLAVWLASTLGSAQNCPLHGPAYPVPTDLASPAFLAAKAKFDEAIASHPDINKTAVSFAVEIYSAHGGDAGDGSIYRAYNTAEHQKANVDVDSDTIWRIHSISKLVTVYTILAKLGYKYWHEPVTKYIPELVGQYQDAITDVNWDDVTLGSLASSMSGISRAFAFTDATTAFTSVPGLRELEDSERVTCGSIGFDPCSREEAMQYILKTWPVSRSFQTPNYSNQAFQILSYAIEKITGEKFPDLITSQLIEPLNLTRTYVTNPRNDTPNVIIEQTWETDMGDQAPMGGYFSTLADLTTLGRSILSSTILPPRTTRQWLKPLTHTSGLTFSLGSPWEILREAVPVVPDSHLVDKRTDDKPAEKTRIVDIFTKQGGGGPYTSIVAISPDHEIGLSLITAGTVTIDTFIALRQLFVDVWVPAAEQAARDQADAGFVGVYELEAAGDGEGENRAEIALLENEPAICLTELVSNGTDMLEVIRANSGQLSHGVAGETRLWLYPMGLVSEAAGGGKRIAFRGVAGLVGREIPYEGKADGCASWAEGDRIRWGNYPSDMLIFDVGADGRATAFEIPALGKTLRRGDPADL